MHANAEAAQGQMSVRLHAPGPRQVLVRVAGTVDASNVRVLVEQVRATFGAAVDVVLDVSGITALTPAGVEALVELYRAATHRGTRLHIVGGARAHTARHAIEHRMPRVDADDVARLQSPAG